MNRTIRQRPSNFCLSSRHKATDLIEMRLERSRCVPFAYQDMVRERFSALARQWSEDTQFVSSAREMAEHPAYRSIIELGWPVVPCLLADLRDSGNHWYLALREITGENPVAPEDRGHVDRMTRAWLEWGYRKHFLEKPTTEDRR